MVVPLLIVLASNLMIQDSLPKIEIQSWTSTDEFKFDDSSPIPLLYQNDSSNSYAIPSNVGGIIISCIANYPIEWNFHHHQLGSFGAPIRGRSRGAAIISTTRLSNDIYDTNSFQFQSELKILGANNIMTGNYTCQRVNSPDTSSSIYIYWEGSSPPYLTLAGMNISIDYDEESKQVIIPCKVSRPDIPVDLYLITYNETIRVSLNNSINYESSRGFILSNLLNPYGQYKCIADAAEDKDFVLVHVLQKDPKAQTQLGEIGNKILYPASFTYDAVNSKFICCSSRDKPPMMAYSFCEHPISCQLRKDSMMDIENSGSRIDSRCAAIKIFIPAAGVVRCVGTGIDIVKTYVFPISAMTAFMRGNRNLTAADNKTLSQPYYSWDTIESDQMIQLRSPVTQPNTTYRRNSTRPRFPRGPVADNTIFYSSQSYMFNCQFSTFYFSHGARWMITWKNKTDLVLEEALYNKTGALGFRQIFRRNVASVIVTVSQEIDSLTCFAPVWNTTEWKKKSLKLTVEEPIQPSIKGEPVEIYEWTLNETSKFITCDFNGKPSPSVEWTKDNKTFSINVNSTTNTSTIEFARVSHETHGEYTCTVRNFNGTATKLFRVLVSEQSSGVNILIGFIVVGFILIIIGSSVLGWKLYKQKHMINHLAQASFKEVHDSQQQRGREYVDVTSTTHVSSSNSSNNNNIGAGTTVGIIPATHFNSNNGNDFGYGGEQLHNDVNFNKDFVEKSKHDDGQYHKL